jgi:methylenetetrahydrofolate dehydrogenase (NADP+) / methenyltetrahydrofolate cyclohydrolase
VATRLDGKALAARIRAEVAAEVAELGDLGLATVLVGDDAASQIYIRLKHKAAGEVGIRPIDRRLPADATEADVIAAVEELNDDESVDGLLVQLPLPGPLDEARVIETLEPVKDVDGIHPVNAGLLYLGTPGHVPATPLGIMELLAVSNVPLEGARAVVIGRSAIVGKPVAHLLLQANATVTICHSRTVELARHTLDADVLVAAVGVAGLVSPDMVMAGATVIDVGMNRTDAGLVGDVDPGAMEVAGRMTPVPGGVGPMTIALLLRNAVRAAKYRRGVLAYPGG